ncbi:hypothetical protein RN629_14655 [Sphingomonadaceae bacterium jetA1]|jgi:hypothetical protein|uniref:hypothetical protein n=1 Tax=Facivitalis istanbulensis TaxID=3075838 RepID=UPI00348E2735
MESPRASGHDGPVPQPWHAIQDIDIVRIVADHRCLANLCNLLERCADELPRLPPEPTAARLCEALTALTEPVENECPAYPALTEIYDPGDPFAAALMEELRIRYATDAMHAQDLADALRAAPGMADRISADTLGYMMRCFFNACRQAMDCEELAILALAGHRLTRAARQALLDSLRFRAADPRPCPA